MPPTVRRAVLSDLDALLGLYRQLGGDDAIGDRERASTELERMLVQPFLTLLVAETDGEVAATVTLVVVPNLTHDARPWIQLENMVVDENQRRSGVGRALLDAARDLAREKNAYKIQLQSANHRQPAHAFYEAGGYSASSVGFRQYFDDA